MFTAFLSLIIIPTFKPDSKSEPVFTAECQKSEGATNRYVGLR